MVDGNTKNSVRSRIDALVGAQEARDGVRVNDAPRENVTKPSDVKQSETPAKIVQQKSEEKKPVEVTQQNKVDNVPAETVKQGSDDKKVVAKENVGAKNRTGIILASVFGVIIVGLVVTILILRPWEDYSTEDDGGALIMLNSATDATNKYDEISNKLETDGDYSIDDAINDYEVALMEGDDTWKTYIAIYYAGFVYEKFGDATRSVNILEGVQDSVPSNIRDVYNDILSQAKMAAEGRNEYEK